VNGLNLDSEARIKFAEYSVRVEENHLSFLRFELKCLPDHPKVEASQKRLAQRQYLLDLCINDTGFHL
jgi:hypothetical protein